MGFFPKFAMDYLNQFTKYKKNAISLATEILKNQMKAFV